MKGKIKYFSPSNQREFFNDLQDGQLIEISTSYYKSTSVKLFYDAGFELFYDKVASKKWGYRLYRAIILEKIDEKPKTTLKFDPAELMI